MKKICFVIASRANYGRVKSVISEFKKNKKYKVQIVLAASSLLERYGDLRKILIKDNFKVDREAFLVVEGENPLTMSKSTGLAIIELSSIFNDLKPDVVITVGDRYETIATAIAASYMNIILAHIQGGEITGSIDESVRHAITKLSHIHFTSTKNAKKNVIAMGEDSRFVFNVGCPSFDLLNKPINQNVVKKFLKGVGANIDLNKKFLLVLFHPVTTEYGQSFRQTENITSAIESLNMQTIWLWPNIDAGSDGISKSIRICREKGKLKNVLFVKNLQVEVYNYLLKKASSLVGNSSSFIREASYFGTPTVLIGKRQEKREISKNVIKCAFNKKEIIRKVKIQIKKRYEKNKLYGDGKSAKRISKLLYNLNPSIQKKLNY